MCPLATGFTGEKRMFWPPPRHDKQRDRRKRSESCYLVPHLSFKQRTPPFDTAFSRRTASKLLTFHWILGWVKGSRHYFSIWKNKVPLKNSLFSADSEKSLLDPKPVGRLLKTQKSSTTREKCVTRNLRIFAYDFLIFWYLFESSVSESNNIRVYFYLDDIWL